MAKRRDLLWLFLFIIVFINGFEAGGYQASLYSIGQTYDLSMTKMGYFASVELFATMLAPLVLGEWADRNDKIKCLSILLGIQIFFAFAIFVTHIAILFILGIFFLGLTTSALQFIAIAELAEAYPLSGKKKIGFMTSMYALGALIAPWVVRFYLGAGIDWRMLFLTLSIGSIIAIIGTNKYKGNLQEEVVKTEDELGCEGSFVFWGIFLLCIVMCVYVGFENGFAFFVDTFFTDFLKSDLGKPALSLFWAVMIPSRVLVGYLSKYAKKILMISVIAIPVVTIIISRFYVAGAVLVLCGVLGFFCGAIYPCVLTTLLQFSGKRNARATAMITVSTGVGGFLFTAITGVLGEVFGIQNALVCLSSFFILSIWAVIMVSRQK
jgi:MFS family permease